MKLKYLFAASLSLMGAIAIAQPPTEKEDNCYQTYAKIFEDRGANPAVDGWADNVIITIRRGADADCYTGKVRVLKDTIADIFIKFTDGDAERLQKKWKKFDKQPTVVTNGISTTMVTIDDELVNIIFPDLLKPKKKAYQKAPLPKLD
jgi:DNA polymerase/3'-5' exonuclease PolX